MQETTIIYNSHSKNQKFFIIFLSIITIIILTTISTTDADLLLNSSLSLALFNIKIPLFVFYILSPVIIISLHFNILLKLTLHLKLIINKFNKDKFLLSLLTHIVVDKKANILNKTTSFIVSFLIFNLSTITLITIFIRFSDYQNIYFNIFHALFIIADIILIYKAKRWFIKKFNNSAELSTIFIFSSKITNYIILLTKIITISLLLAMYLTSGLYNAKIYLYVKNSNIPDFLLANITIDSTNTAIKSKNYLDLSMRNFKNSSFKYIVFPKETNLTGANLTGADLSYSTLNNANLSDADLTNADLTGANLAGADLSNSTLLNNYLINANLTNAVLFGANLSGANLSGANLNGANLVQTNLSNSLLYNTKLIQANLSEANLNQADLYLANLTNADLSTAKLAKAYLYNTNLTGANLTNTSLQKNIEKIIEMDAQNNTIKQKKINMINTNIITNKKINSINLKKLNANRNTINYFDK